MLVSIMSSCSYMYVLIGSSCSYMLSAHVCFFCVGSVNSCLVPTLANVRSVSSSCSYMYVLITQSSVRLPSTVAALRMDDDWEDDAFGTGSGSGAPSVGAGAGQAPAGGAPKRGKKSAGESTVCHVSSCDQPRKRGKRWCERHTVRYDVMMYHAKHNPEGDDSGELLQQLETPDGAEEAMDEWAAKNPDHKRYKTKTCINWAQYRRRKGKRTENTRRSGCFPFEKRQWMLRCENKMGWSSTEAESEWNRYKNDPNTERDKEGLHSSLRCWIPVLQKKFTDNTHYVDDGVEEGGDMRKGIDEEELAALQQMAERQRHHVRDHSMICGFGSRRCGGGAASVAGGSDSDGGNSSDRPTKKPRKEERQEKQMTPQEKRAQARLQRLSRGPRFQSFRSGVAATMSAKIESLKQKTQETRVKILSAQCAMADALRQDRNEGCAPDPAKEAFDSCLANAVLICDALYHDQAPSNDSGGKEAQGDKAKAKQGDEAKAEQGGAVGNATQSDKAEDQGDKAEEGDKAKAVTAEPSATSTAGPAEPSASKAGDAVASGFQANKQT